MNVPNVAINGLNKYLTILEEAWQAHCQLRQKDAPTVISLFAGGGGSSLGYSMAGYRELLAVEYDKHAVQTLRQNFPTLPIWDKDIHELLGEECSRLANMRPRELDILDGSPPCQGFSLAGKRQITDSRNYLFREYVRLLKYLQPKVFVMENVSGLVTNRLRPIFQQIMRELKKAGYLVQCRKLNVRWYHVPQSRERLIFIGVRKDLQKLPSYPRAQSFPYTLRDALANCISSQEEIQEAQVGPAMYKWFSGETRQTWYTIRRYSWGVPRSCITKTPNQIHPSQIRYFTVPECKRICSFPDKFQLEGSFLNKYGRLGNSVPPLFMRAIAQEIRNEIL